MLTNLPPRVQQYLAVLVPVIALVISVFVVYPGWKNWRAVEAQIVANEQKLQTLKETPVPVVAAKVAAAENTPSEAPEFLASVREVAAQAGCSVVGFDLTQPPAPATGEKEMALGGNPDPAKQALERQRKSPVKPVRGKIEVEASYQRIRQFIQGIMGANRLYAVVGIEVSGAKEYPGLVRATIEIERYVVNPEAPPPALPNP